MIDCSTLVQLDTPFLSEVDRSTFAIRYFEIIQSLLVLIAETSNVKVCSDSFW